MNHTSLANLAHRGFGRIICVWDVGLQWGGKDMSLALSALEVEWHKNGINKSNCVPVI